MLADRWMEQGPKGREVILGERFFEQATKSAVPLDPVIVRTLRRSPLAQVVQAWPGQLRVEAQDRRVVLDPGPPSVGSWMEHQNAKHG